MKIGIPNTLFAAAYLPYWQRFFSILGMETIIPGAIQKGTVDRGAKLIPPEFCMPVKACVGQLIELVEQNVELILLPRMIRQSGPDFFCPKFTGLPELARFAAGIDPQRLFSPEVVCNGWNMRPVQYPAAITSLGQLKNATAQAESYWEEVLNRCRRDHQILPDALSGKTIMDPGGIRLGLLGYAYALYDPFISKGIVPKLRTLGAELRTWEMVEPAIIDKELQGLKRPLLWNFGRVLMGAGLHFLKDPGIDGIIYVTTFNCGPDSIAIKMLELEAGIFRKPFLRIILDEHSSDGHLLTRLEAFLEMLTDQKEAHA